VANSPGSSENHPLDPSELNCLGFLRLQKVKAERHGKLRAFDAQKTFLKHGQWAVFAARFITGLRVFAGVLAGVLRMPFSTFMLFSFAGAVCWALAIGYVGFLFGSNWGKLVSFVGRMDRIALVIIASGAAVLLLVFWLRRKKAGSAVK